MIEELEILKVESESKIEELEREIKRLRKIKTECEVELKTTKKRITDMNSDVTITDHAVIRYFERKLGYDVESLRKIILPDEIKEQVRTLGNGEYPVNGFKIVVKNKRVVTVVV